MARTVDSSSTSVCCPKNSLGDSISSGRAFIETLTTVPGTTPTDAIVLRVASNLHGSAVWSNLERWRSPIIDHMRVVGTQSTHLAFLPSQVRLEHAIGRDSTG
jgi:hypothetical protein